MSDYPNPNIQRGDGVSGKGILVALLVILGIIALLAIVGSVGGAGDGAAVPADAITPAAETPVLPAE